MLEQHQWQYQARAEPVLDPAKIAENQFTWFQQPSEPVQESPRSVDQGWATQNLVQNIFDPGDIKWFADYPDFVDEAPRPVDEGWSALEFAPIITAVPDPGDVKWFALYPDHIDEAPRPVDEGWFAYEFRPELLDPGDMKWFQQEPDQVEHPRLLDEGFWAGILDESLFPVVVVPDFSWFMQPSEPVLEMPVVAEFPAWTGVVRVPLFWVETLLGIRFGL